MAENLTKIQEQEDVLSVFDKNAIISASAGSGKTSVLIRKISDYIQNYNVDISNILALTYTNAAAEEMKVRLSTSLIESIEKLKPEDKKVEKLAKQIDNLSTADISTFHSFYERMIKKYFYILGINPSFEILKNEDALVLKDAAFEEAINELKNRDFESYLKITDILGKKRKDNAIKERIFKIDAFLSSQLDKEKWLEETSLNMLTNPEKTYSILKEDINQKINYTIGAFNELLKTANEKTVSYVNKCCLALNELLNIEFKEVYEKINNFSFPKLDIKDEDSVLAEKIKDLRKKFKDSIEDYNFGEFDNIEESFNSCLKNTKTLIDLYKNYIKILKTKKKELNKYEFSDMEDLCCLLLENDKIREAIKAQYKLIFVDEFQDTNPIQYNIIKKISHGNNIFIVGDPKQSIYAFRQTDVDIFNSVYEEYSNSESVALPLKSNFRSNKKILDFVNNVFDVLMKKGLSGIDYKNKSRFSPMSENSCENNSVIISLVEAEKAKEEKKKINSVYEIFQDIPQKEKTNLEAELITHQIGKVLKEKIYDDKLKTQRKVEYKDITILMRNRSKLLKELIENFEKSNIPFLVNDKIDLLLSKDVKLLISLLNLCNNVKDDINLAPVLVSDLVGITFDELAEIRREYAEEEFFYESCFKYLEKNNEISKKLSNFYELLKNLRFEIEFKGIALALNSTISKYKIIEKLLLKDDGKYKAEILNQFVNYIEQSSFNYDLVGFVNFINNSKEVFVSSLKKATDDAVNITTIHGSKGLEYPVVFLCDTGKDLNQTKPDMADLKISKNLGIAIKNYDEKERRIYPSIFEKAIKIENEKKDLAENLRLLYVALTRAKNKLFISGEFDNSKKIEKLCTDFDLLNLKPQSFLNYIIGTFDEEIINKIANKNEAISDDLAINLISQVNFEQDYIKKNDDLNSKLDKIKRYLKLNYEYPHIESTNLAQKTSVTDMLKSADAYGQENITSEPEYFTTKEHLQGNTSAEKGTLIHAILEKIDLKLEGENLDNNIINLIQKYNDNNQFEFNTLFQIIKNSVVKIKALIPQNSKIYREKLFLLNASLNEIFGEGSEEEILIQGKLDLICVGKENIVIDFKYTSINNEQTIIKKYKKQLLAYAFAVEKALSIKVDYVYVLNLNNGNLILIKK
jgi:ATP-dependent helicase/nuclease subunit A